MAGVELSQGYVSFSVATEGAQKQLQSFFSGWQNVADNAGKQVGASLQRSLTDSTKVALAQARAEHERYSIDVQGSMRKAAAAADSHEAALRKVAIAEARLKEMQDSGRATQSQLLAATDRLETARKQVSETSLKQAAADKSLKDAQDNLKQSSDKLAKSQKDVDDSADKAGNSATGMANKIKAGLAGLASKIPNPFKPIEKDAKDSGEESGKKFTQEFKDKTSRLGDGIKAGIAGFMGGLAAGAVSGLTQQLGDFYNEARESQKVGATTAQIIQQTGGAAKISADEIGRLAQSISNKTGVDDEAIQAGANLLLTFKNVRNEVGAGNDVFNRATAAAQDMAAAGFGDAESAAKMLGKALNDPIKGMSAMGRAGVTFSEQQKAQVAAYVKQGDLLAAQKIIMGEVESQVGGVAAASATAGEKFTTQVNNLKENIGTAFMPAIDAVMGKAGQFVEWFGPAFQGVFDLFSKGDFTGDLAKAFGITEDNSVVGFILDLRTTIMDFWAGITLDDPASIGAPLEGFVAIGQQARQFLQDIVGRARDLGAALSSGNINSGPVGVLGAVLDSVKTNALLLWQSFEANLLPAIMSLAGSVRDNVVPFVQHLGDLFVTYLLPVINKFVEFVAEQILPVLGLLAKFVADHVIPTVTRIATILLDTVVPAFAKIYDVILTYVLPPLMSFVRFIIENVMPKVMLLVNEVIVPMFKLVASIVTWAVNNVVVPILKLLGEFLTNVVGPSFKWLWERFISPAIDLIVAGVRWLRDDGVKTFTDFMDRAKATVQTGVDNIARVWDGIRSAFAGPMKFVEGIINGLIDAFNAVSKVFGGPSVGHISITTSAPSSGGRAQAAFATGGVLPGFSPGKDDMHFYSPQWGSLSLSGGEAIMVPEFAKLLGERGVEMLNQAARAGSTTLHGVLGSMHFAGGGIVNLRGHTFTAEFARRLQLAEAMARATFQITQGGFRPATSYSGTSHAGDAVDLSSPITTGALIALRSVGIPSWDRTNKGPWIPHIHGVPLPWAGRAGGSAVWQAQDYLAGGDGLGGRDNGPRVGALLGSIEGVFLNLAEGARSLIDWPRTFAKQISDASKLVAPGAFGDVLRAVPGKVVQTITDGAGKVLGLPGFASGVSSAPPGWAWVGEGGPELVNFAGGERVLSHRDSTVMSSRAADGLPGTVVLVDADGTFISRMRVEARESLSGAWSAGTVLARKEGASR